MQTGSDIHDSLVTRIHKVRRELENEDRGIKELQGELAGLGQRRGEIMRSLAEFHLPEMSDEAVASTLAGMETSVRAIFDEKKDRLQEVERLIPGQREQVGEAEAHLERVTQALNETGRERSRLARIVYAELQAMERWRVLFAEVRRLEARVTASEKRHEAALRERDDKTPAYERDPFFSYLAGRRYGTTAATGNALTKRLDGWVAGVTGYDGARAKHDFLSELPGHAAVVLEDDRTAFGEACAPLVELEAEVIDRHGLNPVLERGDRLYAQREEARESLRAEESALRGLTDELAALHDQRGSYYQSAIEGLESYLEGYSLDELVTMARATGDPRDDVLVVALRDIDGRLAELRAQLAESRDERARLAERLAGLEDIRDQFVGDDWNGRRSRFDDGLDMNALLVGYLVGNHSFGHVHRALGSSQSFLPADGGFDATSLMTGGGFGGGGFSSGGGFGGGGGFSTGGGF